jgi:hypothetical protein
MKISKAPVCFANRADLIECDSHAFSVGAHVPEQVVMLNVYAKDGTRVLQMTAEEAHDLARHLAQGANDLSSRVGFV